MQRLSPIHAAATAQAEGLTAWLAAAGVDAAKQAVAPSAAGLVCARPVKAGEQLFAVPAAAWITAETAAQSDIGQHLQGCVRAGRELGANGCIGLLPLLHFAPTRLRAAACP